MADQAVSSITNFAVGVFVARSLGEIEFGIFSLAWVTYGFIMNISRGMTTDPLAVRFSGDADAAWRRAVGQASGTCLLVGLGTGGLTALAGLLIGGALGAALIALGVVLPAVLLQDCWRFAFFAAGQGHKAFANDLVWGVLLVPALLVATRYGTVPPFLLGWGVAAAGACVFGCWQTRLMPRPWAARQWLSEQRDLSFRYLFENTSIGGASQLRAYGLGAIAGVAAVGTTRGAELLMGPFFALLMGFGLVAVPEAARVLREAPHRLTHFCLLLGGVQAAAALLWGTGLLVLLPDSVGRSLLGDVWLPASALILPATLAVAHAAFHTGAAVGLRALGNSRRSLRAQLIGAATYATFGLIGAALGGALGSSWGVAVATLCGVAVWWWQFRRAIREHRRAAVPVPPSGRPD
jgi:O-antigen/teichoic acid export membrane protein